MLVDSDLIRAILVDPYDDTPRLIYADHLEDSGCPDNAELIRKMIQLDEFCRGRDWFTWLGLHVHARDLQRLLGRLFGGEVQIEIVSGRPMAFYGPATSELKIRQCIGPNSWVDWDRGFITSFRFDNIITFPESLHLHRLR